MVHKLEVMNLSKNDQYINIFVKPCQGLLLPYEKDGDAINIKWAVFIRGNVDQQIAAKT